MARLVGVEWDAREARVVVARTAGREVGFEEAFAVELGEGAESAAGDAGQRLAAALSERSIGRGEVLVAVLRGKVELRLLQTPAAPDDELPDLVRFQALRQFAGMDADWPLDFVRLASPDESQIRVLAAAAAPKLLEEVHAVCQTGLGPPKRLILRPCASASLLHRRMPDERCRLLVELSADEADLTVLVGGQAVLLRSVRLPAQDLAPWLVGEIRRTMAAAENQLGSQSVDSVVLCGSEGEHAGLFRELGQQLSQPVELFDPFAGATLGPHLQDALPAHPGRYAALLGLLQDEAAERPPAIDFLNPRRRPAAPKRGLHYATAAAAAVILLAVLGFFLGARLRTLDGQIQTLREESQDCDADVKAAQKLRAEISEIDKFTAGDVNWLDELYEVSAKFPPPEKAIVDQAALQATPGGGGQIELDGFVRDPEVIETMEKSLRFEGHQVTGSGGQYDDRQKGLKWKFKERINVAAPPVQEAEDHE
jgi:Tfp pilus assembly PilM family ATPase